MLFKYLQGSFHLPPALAQHKPGLDLILNYFNDGCHNALAQERTGLRNIFQRENCQKQVYYLPFQVAPSNRFPLLPLQQHLDQVLTGGVGIHSRDPLCRRVDNDRQLHGLRLDQQGETLSRSQFFLRWPFAGIALVSSWFWKTPTSGLLVEQRFVFWVWIWVVLNKREIPAPPSLLPLNPIPFTNHPGQTIATLKSAIESGKKLKTMDWSSVYWGQLSYSAHIHFGLSVTFSVQILV